jgi:hypothetical protein
LAFPDSEIRALSKAFLESYCLNFINEDGHLPDFIEIKDFSKALALLCFYVIENVDLRST